MHNRARMLFLVSVVVASLALLDARAPLVGSIPTPDSPALDGTVYLGGQLDDAALVSLGAAVASQPGALLLLDSAPLTPYLRQFLTAYRPSRVVPVGGFTEDQAALSRRLGVPVEPILPWQRPTSLCPLWRDRFPGPSSLVVCPARPRELLLHAALLAARMNAPLWVGGTDDDLVASARALGVRRVVMVGPPRPLPCGVEPVLLRKLRDVQAACRAWLGEGPVRTALITNPEDQAAGLGGMSALAPYLAATKRARLVLTNDTGTDVAARVEEACRDRRMARLDTLLLLASLDAIPVWQRPNPIPGDRDEVIDLEPLTPTDGTPVSFAIGRLFHEDRAVVPLLLARQRLMATTPGPRRALVASNPGGGLGLLEAFSRNTAQELGNAGYAVTARYGKELTAAVLRREMPRHEVILWEGHHNTLIKEWGFTEWDEPLPPSLVFLQSCLALMPEKVQPLLSRGATAVVGTSTRTYSGSGGAFSLAFFNALLYDGQTLGGSLRQAKNFLLAYAALKEKRLGDQASRLGANHRAAWAFTLWGDPTFRLPLPQAPATARTGIRHTVTSDEIVVELPGKLHDRVTSDRYQVRMPPNGRLAGLVRKNGDAGGQPVVPLVFAEVRLPAARKGTTPQLRTRLPRSQWVFLWDSRRQTGYLLVAPRSCEKRTLRFRVSYSGAWSVASGQ